MIIATVGQPFLAVLPFFSAPSTVKSLSPLLCEPQRSLRLCVIFFPLILLFILSLWRIPLLFSYPAFFFSAPSKVITFPRSFTTPFSAPVGIRKISSNNPVIAVKNSSMLSNRSRV
jgi:hypothetical protein